MSDLLPLLQSVKPKGKGWMAKCPAHEDGSASLSVDRGDDGRWLLKCFAGCEVDSICAALKIKPADLFADKSRSPMRSSIGEHVATYIYEGADGKPRFQVRKFVQPGGKKSFLQYRPDGNGGWVPGLKGVEPVLYGLPQIMEAVERGERVFIVEGEKDVEAMRKAGFCATCNPMGAGKWNDRYSEALRDLDVVIVPDNDDPGRKHAELVASKLKGVARSVKCVTLPKGKDAHDYFAAGGTADELRAMADSAKEPEAPKSFADIVEERRFNPLIQPPTVRAVYSLSDAVICTAGNLTTITAHAKTGKSGLINAMLAAPMATAGSDCLNVRSENPDGRAVLHFDTEQSKEDHWHQVARAIRRAGREQCPPWLLSYCLTGFSARQIQEAIWMRTESTAAEFGGVHSIIIDGYGDLVADVNDAEECNGFVARLHALAIRFDCPIAGVLHFNPGTEKTRGHLGSQLERKAESNLRLDKDGEITSVWSDKQRRAPILKGKGPRFTWSAEASMHVSVEPGQSAQDNAKVAEAKDLRDDVFRGRPSMRRCDIEQEIQTGTKCGPKTAQRTVTKWATWGLIEKSVAGLWIPKA